MIDFILLAMFLGTGGYAIAVVWRKIPLLLAVPQPLIRESFVTRPSRVRRYAEAALEFWYSRRYRELIYALLLKWLARLRIWLLRLERLTFRAMEAVAARRHGNGGNGNGQYWSELKQWKQEARENGNSLPHDVLNPPPPPPLDRKG